MKTIRTATHDIAGNSIVRVIRLCLINKMVPLGNFGGGVGLRPGLVLMLLHLTGKPLFRLLIRFEGRLHRLHQVLKRRR